MAITASQAQGLVLALFGASAGGHLAALQTGVSVSGVAADLVTAAGLVLDQDLSSNSAFTNLVLTVNLKLTGTALTEAQKWMDGEIAKGTSRADILAAAVTFLDGLTDSSNVFFSVAANYRDTVKAAVAWSQGAGATVFGVSTLMAQQGNVAYVPGQSFTLTTSTDVLVGTAGNDTFAGSSTTTAAADAIIDSSTTDKDVANLTGLTAVLGAITIKNVETINVTSSLAGGTAFTVDATKMTGANTITVGRDNIAGSILGKGTAEVDNVNASSVTVKAGAGVTAFTTTQLDATTASDGYTVDATGVAGNVTTGGAAKVTANDVDAQHTVSVQGGLLTAGDKFAVTVDAAKAGTVNVGNTNAITGSVTVNAAAATDVTVTLTGSSSAGTINAAKAKTIAVNNINATGATIAGGTISTSATTTSSWATFTLDGTSASTDAATVTAGGYVNINKGTDQVEYLTLGGDGAAVTYTYGSTNVPTKTTLTGADSVTVRGDLANFAGKTIVDTTTGGVGKLKISASATPATADLHNVSVASVELAADNTNHAITLASGQKVILSKDQTGGAALTSYTAKGTLNLETGDDTAANGDVITIDAGGVTTTSGYTTINLTANVGNFTATGFDTGSATTTTLNVTGAKDVTLNTVGTLKAKTIDATQLTGVLTATQTANSKTLASGTGADVITLDDSGAGTTVFSTNAGDGDNVVTVTSAADGSVLTTGAGDDTVHLNDNGAYLISTGAGADQIYVSTDSDAIIDGGTGTDTLVSDNQASVWQNVNFSFSGIEKVLLSGVNGYLELNNLAFANNKTFTLTADHTGGQLWIDDADQSAGGYNLVSHRHEDNNGVRHASVNDTIDLSTITVSSSAGFKPQIVVDVGQGSNKLVGSAATNDVLDVHDLYDMIDNANTSASAYQSNGVVVNLGTTAVAATTLATKGMYLGGALTSAAAGSASYLYGYANSASKVTSDAVNTVSSFEDVNGSAGADYIVGSALANTIDSGNGNDYVDGGAGADTITTNTGNATVVGGTGADAISFGSGTNVLKYSATAQTGAQIADGASTASLDVISGLDAGDQIDLSALATTLAIAGASMAGTSGKVSLIQGTYDATAKTFTAGAGGSDHDTYVVWDNNGTTAGITYEAIVLVGFVDGGTTAISSGVITLA